MPRLSLIVPIYNAAATLRRSLNSVLTQTFSDFECLLVDDGSIDASLSICQEYVDCDSRFKVLTKHNEGEYSARNLGLQYAQGEYFCYLDSDDQLHHNYLQSLIGCIDKSSDIDLVIQGIIRVANDHYIQESPEGEGIYSLHIEPQPFFRSVNFHHFGYSFSKLFRTSIIKDNALEYSNKVILAVDLDFLLRYLRYCRKVLVVNDAHYYYIIRRGSLTYTINPFSREYSGLLQLSSSWSWWTSRFPEKALFDKEGTSIALMVQRCINSCYLPHVGYLERRKNFAQISNSQVDMFYRYADESTAFLSVWKWLFYQKKYLLLDILMLFVFRVIHRLK